MGQIEEWFYRSLAGIVPDEANPGFKHFFIKPELVGDLSFVKASYKSVYGKIVSEWEKKDGQLILNIEIPPNTSASVIIPVSNVAHMKVNGESFAELNLVENKSGFTLGSGIYKIECSL
ncbi:alpha-L-rhamnosidase C-terminal domain-containing protein [Thalassobellus suaedae]